MGRSLALLLCLTLALVLGACGGGGGGDSGGETTAEFEAVMTSTMLSSTSWGYLETVGKLGDTSGAGDWRVFMFFDLASLPKAAQISRAVLVLPVPSSDGSPEDQGPVLLDHEGRETTDITAQADHYISFADEAVDSFGIPVSRSPGAVASWTSDVTAWILGDLATASAHAVFRLRTAVATNGDLVTDLYRLGNYVPDQVVLRVTYSP